MSLAAMHIHHSAGPREPRRRSLPYGPCKPRFHACRQRIAFDHADEIPPGEGKSVSVADLAVTMALAGKKVVVVDGDMRRSRPHIDLDIADVVGLSTVATGRSALKDTMVQIDVSAAQRNRKAKAASFTEWAHDGDARSQLNVLPSRPIPPNPGEIVASKRFASILRALEAEADLVIVDSPTMLAVGDTAVIASPVDGLVILVDMKVVRKLQLEAASDQLMRLPTRLLMVIVRPHGASGKTYTYSPYYYGYRYAEDGSKTNGRSKNAPVHSR